MFVRAPLSFHTAPLPGHNQSPLSPIIPAHTGPPRGRGVWSYQSKRLTAHQGTTRNVFSFTSFTSPTSFTSRSPVPTFPRPASTFTSNMSYTLPHEVTPK